jgi:hypothetical protein
MALRRSRRAWMALAVALIAAQLPSPILGAPSPLGLAWGVIAEPAAAGEAPPGQLAEHLEFLLAHGWQAVRTAQVASGSLPQRSVLLGFDDPPSALLYAEPLLSLLHIPASVTVSAEQLADPALTTTLVALAASPWFELLPRIEPKAAALALEVRCAAPSGTAAAAHGSELSRLHRELAGQVARLRDLTGAAPVAVAWADGAWSGEAEAVARGLGLTVQLPTFELMPPRLAPPRVARYATPPWAGIWAPVQASQGWDPADHPVRFVEVEAAWICAGDDPQARVDRVVEVARRLALNGVRILPGGAEGVWFPTDAATVRGDVVGPLARALRQAGIRRVVVDLPATGDRGRDVALASDLARSVEIDVAVLPVGAMATDRLGEAVSHVRPAARLAWQESGRHRGRAFRLAPAAGELEGPRGLTVGGTTPGAANVEAIDRAVAGWVWIGVPVELAEGGLAQTLATLSAFALPTAGEPGN